MGSALLWLAPRLAIPPLNRASRAMDPGQCPFRERFAEDAKMNRDVVGAGPRPRAGDGEFRPAIFAARELGARRGLR